MGPRSRAKNATADGDVETVIRDTATRVLATARDVIDIVHTHLHPPAGEDLAVATQEAAELTERVAAAARRTGDLRELATATGRPTPTAAAGIADHSTTTAAQAAQRVRLLGANNAAAAYFAAQYRSSWAPGYLQ